MCCQKIRSGSGRLSATSLNSWSYLQVHLPFIPPFWPSQGCGENIYIWFLISYFPLSPNSIHQQVEITSQKSSTSPLSLILPSQSKTKPSLSWISEWDPNSSYFYSYSSSVYSLHNNSQQDFCPLASNSPKASHYIWNKNPNSSLWMKGPGII